MVDYVRLSALFAKNKCHIYLMKKKTRKTLSVPGSDEAGGYDGLPGPPGDAGQVVLDVHVGLDVRHELDHHDVGHRVSIKLYKIF